MAAVALLLAPVVATRHLAWFQPLLLAAAVVALTDMEAALLVVRVVVRHGLLDTVAAQEQQDRVMLAAKTQPLATPKVAAVAVVQAQ